MHIWKGLNVQVPVIPGALYVVFILKSTNPTLVNFIIYYRYPTNFIIK